MERLSEKIAKKVINRLPCYQDFQTYAQMKYLFTLEEICNEIEKIHQIIATTREVDRLEINIIKTEIDKLKIKNETRKTQTL